MIPQETTVLVVGGHGRTGQRVTTRLLSLGYIVKSLIRDAAQTEEILSLGKNRPGKISVIVKDLDGIHDEGVNEALGGVNIVVWAAGTTGSQADPRRTAAIERDAPILFIRHAFHRPILTKFISVSASICRSSPAPWWNDEEVALYEKMRTQIMPAYCEAKTEVDEYLVSLRRKEEYEWAGISVRPGGLMESGGAGSEGRVDLGKARLKGFVSRDVLAEVLVEILVAEQPGSRWIDLLGGEEDVKDAVQRVIRDDVTSMF